MKTIAQIIDELMTDLPPRSERGEMTHDEWFEWFLDAFNAGVDYVTMWIPVEEKSPPNGVPILLKFVNNTYEVGYYLKHKYRGFGFYSYSESDIEFILEAVTHWRYINFEL